MWCFAELRMTAAIPAPEFDYHQTRFASLLLFSFAVSDGNQHCSVIPRVGKPRLTIPFKPMQRSEKSGGGSPMIPPPATS